MNIIIVEALFLFNLNTAFILDYADEQKKKHQTK